MNPSEPLLRVRKTLDTVLAKVDIGTQADYRSPARVDLAHRRALDRAGGGQLPGPTRGGSSSPPEKDERIEAERVKRQAERDARRLEELSRQVDIAMREIATITDRQAEVIHESKLPVNVLPGCRSCARREDDNGITIGGHHAAIYEKSIGSGLCRDCWEFRSATDALPPIRWCHLLHAEGKRAANRWLAQNYPNLVASVRRATNPTTAAVSKKPPRCGHPTGKDGAPCARRLMHEGQCFSAAELAAVDDQCHTPTAS